MLERLSFVDDPGLPTELGDGEGEDEMHLSEARAELYDAIEKWEHRKDETEMSRLPWKNGYHEGETLEIDPQEWSVTKVGFLDEVSVTYRTGDGKLTTDRKQVPDNWTEQTLLEMLGRKTITYPD